MKCPRCQSEEVETSGTFELIDSDKEGDLITQRAYCRKCGYLFDFDDFVPRPERMVEQ